MRYDHSSLIHYPHIVPHVAAKKLYSINSFSPSGCASFPVEYPSCGISHVAIRPSRTVLFDVDCDKSYERPQMSGGVGGGRKGRDQTVLHVK